MMKWLYSFFLFFSFFQYSKAYNDDAKIISIVKGGKTLILNYGEIDKLQVGDLCRFYVKDLHPNDHLNYLGLAEAVKIFPTYSIWWIHQSGAGIKEAKRGSRIFFTRVGNKQTSIELLNIRRHQIVKERKEELREDLSEIDLNSEESDDIDTMTNTSHSPAPKTSTIDWKLQNYYLGSSFVKVEGDKFGQQNVSFGWMPEVHLKEDISVHIMLGAMPERGPERIFLAFEAKFGASFRYGDFTVSPHAGTQFFSFDNSFNATLNMSFDYRINFEKSIYFMYSEVLWERPIHELGLGMIFHL